jgi:RNA recognition motif-containing protein
MAEETPERRAGSYLPPHARSQNSSNWRMKDETPRSENPTSYRNRGPQSPTGVDLVSPNNVNYEAPAGTRLYVGNLLYTASRDDVEGLFTSNGHHITGISMSIDPFTNRNPSYAFVDFETAEEASKAMDSVNGLELLGREVKVNPGVRRQPGQGERRVKNFANGTPQRESTQRKYCRLFFLLLTNNLNRRQQLLPKLQPLDSQRRSSPLRQCPSTGFAPLCRQPSADRATLRLRRDHSADLPEPRFRGRRRFQDHLTPPLQGRGARQPLLLLRRHAQRGGYRQRGCEAERCRD